MNVIDEFAGVYGFLSNFYPAEIYLDGVRYPTVEHAYQAAKMVPDNSLMLDGSMSIQDALAIQYRANILYAPTPGLAKRLGKVATLRPDWDEKTRISTMEGFLRQKFASITALSYRLVDTHPAELIEGNWWGDRFWGVYKGKGRNELGKLHMKIRAELR